jgi:programmed cell death protein 5
MKDNIEEDRKKLLFQNAYLQAIQQQAQLKQTEEALKSIMLKILTKNARERLNNLKIVKPELALQLEIYLAQLYQSGQIKEQITEQQLILILKNLSNKQDFNIKIKKK